MEKEHLQPTPPAEDQPSPATPETITSETTSESTESAESASPTPEKQKPGLRERFSKFFHRVVRKKSVETSQPAPVPAQNSNEVISTAEVKTLSDQKNSEKKDQERVKTLEKVKDPYQEIQKLAQELQSPTEWRAEQLKKDYKGLLGHFHALAANEHDIELNERGETTRKWLNELKGAGIRAVMNRQSRSSAVGAAAAYGIGMMVGGAGLWLPASAAVLGVMGGRLFVEGWKIYDTHRRERRQARQTRERGNDPAPQGGLRGEIAQLEYRNYVALHQMARHCLEEGISPEEKAERARQYFELKNQANEQVMELQKTQIGEEAVWDRRRHWGGIIGGALAGVGVTALNWHHVMTMHLGGLGNKAAEIGSVSVNGQPVPAGVWDINAAREVTRVHGAWHFLYRNAVEASVASQNLHAHVVGGLGQHGGHLLGEGTSAVAGGIAKNLAPIFGAFAGLFVGSIGPRTEAQRLQELQEGAENAKRANEQKSQFLTGELPKPESSGGGAGTTEKNGPKTPEEW